MLVTTLAHVLLFGPALSPEAGFVEVGLGASVCGARAEADCDGTGTGFALDLHGGWQALPWLALGGTVGYLDLPAEGGSGSLLFVGPEVTASLGAGPWSLQAALAVGFDALLSEADTLTGWGAVRIGAGGRWRAADHLRLGLDYGLLLPRFGDQVCRGGACADVTAAVAHQFGLIVGVPF